MGAVTDALSVWWVHTVTVERVTGQGAHGPVFAAATVEPCFIEDRVQMVRALDGAEVVSSTTVAFPASVVDIPPGSRVALPTRVGTVITWARAAGSPAPGNCQPAAVSGVPVPEHCQAALT